MAHGFEWCILFRFCVIFESNDESFLIKIIILSKLSLQNIQIQILNNYLTLMTF